MIIMIIMIIMKGHVAPYHTHWCERMTKVDEKQNSSSS